VSSHAILLEAQARASSAGDAIRGYGRRTRADESLWARRGRRIRIGTAMTRSSRIRDTLTYVSYAAVSHCQRGILCW
jgi:hypothetical protein